MFKMWVGGGYIFGTNEDFNIAKLWSYTYVCIKKILKMHICVMPHMHCIIIENLKQSQKSNSSLTHMIPPPLLLSYHFLYLL